jgi:superfamily II DNA or RNA helicase
MEEAIAEGYLCKYEYTPHIVYLNEDEMSDYVEITKKLSALFGGNREDFNSDSVAKMLLMKRKRIIHKATNKLSIFKSIIDESVEAGQSLTYSFIYVPEGVDKDDLSLIDAFMNVVDNGYKSIKSAAYTQLTENRDEVMELFSSGNIDMLFAMKCLDEGVDIPRTELAIFCSSTGTPRQFIQRRGRVLRTHKDKPLARIHDLVVFPSKIDGEETSELEKKLIKSELVRVVHFASLALNYNAAMQICDSIGNNYGVSVYALEYELDLYGSEDKLEE